MPAILLITHEGLGEVLLQTATKTMGQCPLPVRTLSVPYDSDPETLTAEAAKLAQQLDSGNGVLILTDLYGSTPSNIACRLHQPGRIQVVAGVNLPMLLRVFNYATLDLDELSEKAASGGRNGIVECSKEESGTHA